MTEPVFVAESARLLIAAGTGIILLLLLIIKFKIVKWNLATGRTTPSWIT